MMNRGYAMGLKACVVCLAVAMLLGGCSSIIGLPMDGDVQTMQPSEQQVKRVFTDPLGPELDAQPESIVKGFFDAMPAGVQSDGFNVARQFLTSESARTWDGNGLARVFSGSMSITRTANSLDSEVFDDSELTIEVGVHLLGRVNGHGLYQPLQDTSIQTMSMVLTKNDGQWRITDPPDGVFISEADFQQVFRQVSVYRLSSSTSVLIPDVRWFSWRNWRTLAVNEVLCDDQGWLSTALDATEQASVRLAVDSVPVIDGRPQVQLTDAFSQLDKTARAVMVRRIRLTLGDGSADYDIAVRIGANSDYSTADERIQVKTLEPSVSMYSLSAGHIVSLDSSSPLRIAEVADTSGVKDFVFFASGGALLRNDGTVECLDAHGNSCGRLFESSQVSAITEGLSGEIWAISDSGRSLMVYANGQEQTLEIPWLTGGRVVAITISPEGSRVALSIAGGDLQGVVISGVARDAMQKVTALGTSVARVSYESNVSMLTFYNDITLVYVASSHDPLQQRAFRQTVPGIEISQKIPDGGIVALSAGQLSLNRRLTALDSSGMVRALNASLDGVWSIADSQVAAISNR